MRRSPSGPWPIGSNGVHEMRTASGISLRPGHSEVTKNHVECELRTAVCYPHIVFVSSHPLDGASNSNNCHFPLLSSVSGDISIPTTGKKWPVLKYHMLSASRMPTFFRRAATRSSRCCRPQALRRWHQPVWVTCPPLSLVIIVALPLPPTTLRSSSPLFFLVP